MLLKWMFWCWSLKYCHNVIGCSIIQSQYLAQIAASCRCGWGHKLHTGTSEEEPQEFVHAWTDHELGTHKSNHVNLKKIFHYHLLLCVYSRTGKKFHWQVSLLFTVKAYLDSYYDYWSLQNITHGYCHSSNN